jgi:hypothetical protein
MVVQNQSARMSLEVLELPAPFVDLPSNVKIRVIPAEVFTRILGFPSEVLHFKQYSPARVGQPFGTRQNLPGFAHEK